MQLATAVLISLRLDVLAMSASPASKGFMDTLPDPMKLDPYQVGFVMLLLTLLYLFLKACFFKPVGALIDERQELIQAGTRAKAEAAASTEKRQADYDGKLRELRAKAFEHRKALAQAAALERQALLDEARSSAASQRRTALDRMQTQQEEARIQLVAQVDALADSMVRQLLQRT